MSMTKGEAIVLGNFLSYWPDNMSFEEVCNYMLSGDDDDEIELTIWEPYEEWDRSFLINHMVDLRDAIDEEIK